MAYRPVNNFSTTLSAALELDHQVIQLNSVDRLPDISGVDDYTYLTLEHPESGLAEPENIRITDIDRARMLATIGARDISGTGSAVYPAGTTTVEVRNIAEAINDIAADRVRQGLQSGEDGELVTRQELQNFVTTDINPLKSEVAGNEEDLFDLQEAVLQDLVKEDPTAIQLQLGTSGGMDQTVDLQGTLTDTGFHVLSIGRGATAYDPILVRDVDVVADTFKSYPMRVDGTPTGRSALLQRHNTNEVRLAIDAAGAYERITLRKVEAKSSANISDVDGRVNALVRDPALQSSTERWDYDKLPEDLQQMMGGGNGDGDGGGSGSVIGELVATSAVLPTSGSSVQAPGAWTIESDYTTAVGEGQENEYRYLTLSPTTTASGNPIFDWGEGFVGWIIRAKIGTAEQAPMFVPAFGGVSDRAASRNILGIRIAGNRTIRMSVGNVDGVIWLQLGQKFGSELDYRTWNLPANTTVEVYTAKISGGGGGGGGSSSARTDDDIRGVVDTQVDAAADTIANKPAQLDFFKDDATNKLWAQIKGGAVRSISLANDTLTVTAVDGTTSTITLPTGSTAHGSNSAGSVQSLGNVNLNLIHTPGLYISESANWTGSNSPLGQSGLFALVVTNIEGVANGRDGGIEQTLWSLTDLGQALYFRSTPNGTGTSTAIPTTITESWQRYDNVGSLPDPAGGAELLFIAQEQASQDVSRQDHEITFSQSSPISPWVGQSLQRPTNNVIWRPANALRQQDANKFQSTFITTDLDSKTLVAAWLRGVRIAGVPTTDGIYTRLEVLRPGLLSASNNTIDVNFEFSDGSFLWQSQVFTDAHPIKITLDALKAALNIPSEGKLRGIGSLPSTDDYEDGDGWLVPSTGTLPGFFEVAEGDGVTTSIEGTWTPAMLSFEGIQYYGFNSVTPGDRITLPMFGVRPSWMPASIRALYTFGNSQVRMILDSDHGGSVHVVRGSVAYNLVDRGETTGVTGGYFLYAAFNVTPNWDASSQTFQIHTPENEGFQRTGKHWKLIFASSPDAFTAEDKTKLDELAAIGNATDSTAGYMSGEDKTKLDGLQAKPPGVNEIPANWQSNADPKAPVGSRVDLLRTDMFAIYRELQVAATRDGQGRAIRAWSPSAGAGSLEGVARAGIAGLVGLEGFPSNYPTVSLRNRWQAIMGATNTPSWTSIEVNGVSYAMEGSTDQNRFITGLAYNDLEPGTVYRFNGLDSAGNKVFEDLTLEPHQYIFDGRVPVLDGQAVTIADIDARIAEFAQRGQPNPHMLILDQTIALNATRGGVAHLNTPVQPNPTFSVSGADVLQISVQWQTSTGTIRISPANQYGFTQVTNSRLRSRPAYEAVAALAGNVGVPIASVEVRNASRVIATATLFVARTTGNLLTLFMQWTPGSNPDAAATGAVQARTEIIASPLG